MADKDSKKRDKNDAGQPGFDPKPVHVGGETLLERLMPYRYKILTAVVLGFAVWGVIAVVFYFRTSKREASTAQLAKVLEISQRSVRPEGVEPTPSDPDPTFGSHKERADAMLAALEQAGASASPLYRASVLMQAGKVDEAIIEYRKMQVGRTLDNVLAREGLGIALETKAQQNQDAAARQKGLEEALEAFQSMQPLEDGPRRAFMHYHEGRILTMLGKPDEAKAAFDKAKQLDTSGQLAELIDERLASLGAS